jgi:hypothetical protein
MRGNAWDRNRLALGRRRGLLDEIAIIQPYEPKVAAEAFQV